MAPATRSVNVVLSRSKPSLEIIPDQRFLVFHGSEHEASPVKLTGRVRLHAPEATSILRPKIQMIGKRKVQMTQAYAGIHARKTFLNVEQKLGSIESAHKVNAGTIEWPFEFQLSPSMPESVEGLENTYVVYNLNATVSRTGWNAKDVHASAHIRVVRTMGFEEISITQPRVNSDIWANKVSYTVSIPSNVVVYGTSIAADVELTPLKKGIQFGPVEIQLIEYVTKKIQEHEFPSLHRDIEESYEREVFKGCMDIPDTAKITIDDDEGTENPRLEDERYKFQAVCSLPQSLNKCIQDVDHHSINILHKLKIAVNITNPEGHVSQLVCRLPVCLYISPELPVDDANEVHPGESRLSDAELNQSAVATAPPMYGRHQLDQIYQGIDPSGFISRAGSVPGTPAGLMAQSRRGSHENVLSLNSLADTDPASLHHGQQLRSRLANLEISNAGHVLRPTGTSTNHSPPGGISPGAGSTERLIAQFQPGRLSPGDRNHNHHRVPSTQSPGSARGNNSTSYFPSVGSHGFYSHYASPDDENLPNPSYDLAGLSRVPSYGSAIRTPTGGMTPFTEGPPSYIEATSRPPSPSPVQNQNHDHGHGHVSRQSPAQVRANA